MALVEETSGKTAVKAGFWYTASSVAIRSVGIITSPIYTRMLTPDDYGIANTFNSWIEIINVFTCLCVVYSIGRAKLDFKDKFDEYLSSLQSLSSTFAFGVLIIALFFGKQLSAWMQYEIPLVMVLFVYLVIAPSVEYMLQKCKYEYQFKQSIIISAIICIGTVIMSILLMLLFSNERYFGKILGTLVMTFMLGIFFYIRIFRQGKVFYNREYWAYALKIGLPMIPHALALIVLAQVDRIMIKDMCGEAEAGLYGWGYGIATLLSMFTNAIGQAWLPWFNEQLYNGKKDQIRAINKKIIALGVFLTIGFITVAPEVVLLMGSEDYWVAKWVIPPIALGTLAQYFYTNYVNLELFYKKTAIIAISSVSAAIINYFLNLWLIPQYGYLIAAYTTLISYLFLMLFHYVATRFVLKKRVYANVFIFCMMIFSLILGMGLTLLYDTILMRYALAAVVLGILAIIKRRDILIGINIIKIKFNRG
jgi:O-antigen/teichoic acid export membrane protein